MNKTVTRGLFVASCLALVALAGCGGASGPTAPSAAAGATVAGIVNGAGALPPQGLTISVSGTSLSAAADGSGYFQIANLPSGNVQLQFKDATVNASAQLSNVRENEFIEIQVQVSGTTATIVSEVRSDGKVALCHRTESGTYHLIDVSVNAEPAHRAHGDAKIGEPVPGRPQLTFGESCRIIGPAISIKKFTNGQDADHAPGPSILVGGTVTWTYVVANIGTVNLTNVLVLDDQGVTVSCGGQTTLAAGMSMTCTGSGIAAAGQYRNVATVTADSTSGSVTDSDVSHYYGTTTMPPQEGQKVQLCHRTGNGSYHLIEVSIDAEPAHRAHGDGRIGEPVPGQIGKVFGTNCSVI